MVAEVVPIMPYAAHRMDENMGLSFLMTLRDRGHDPRFQTLTYTAGDGHKWAVWQGVKE